MAIQENQIEDFKKYFEKMSNYYEKVNYCDKEDTLRTISFAIEDHNDNNLSVEILRFMLDILIEKALDREVMNTGVLFAKALFNLNKNAELGKLLKELFDYFRTIQNLDESYNQVKLELLVFKIQYCDSMKDYKQSKVKQLL